MCSFLFVRDNVLLPETSLDLLIQILDEKTPPCPQHIAAVTADVDALKLNEDSFRQMVTVVLHVAPGAGEWKEELQNLVWLASRVETPSNNYDYDACFITALRVPELQQLLKATPISWGPEVLVSKSLLCRHGVLEETGNHVVLCVPMRHQWVSSRRPIQQKT